MTVMAGFDILCGLMSIERTQSLPEIRTTNLFNTYIKELRTQFVYNKAAGFEGRVIIAPNGHVVRVRSAETSSSNHNSQYLLPIYKPGEIAMPPTRGRGSRRLLIMGKDM